jgi:predicted hydrocarbon binding protein
MQEIATGVNSSLHGSVEHVPKDVLAFEFSPERRLAHFVVTMKNVPGALEFSAAIATKHKVNILSGFHHAPSASNNAFWSFFADFTNAAISPGDLAKEFEFLPSTVDVHFKVPKKGLLIDSYHFPLRWGGQRAIVMRTETLASIFSRIIGVFGDGAAARVVMYQMGEAAGREMMRDLLAQIGDVVRDELRSIMGLYSSNGWGIFDLVSVDLSQRKAEIRVHDSFECVHYKKSALPRSNFIRGHIAGWFSELVGSRVEVVEEYCEAKSDPFCYFVVEPPTL